MSFANTTSAYQETEVLSSSPERLVPVLYAHLLVNLKRAAAHIRKGEIEGKFISLTRASDIIAELFAALDFDAGGELASRLSGLYGFWLKELALAGRDLSSERLARVEEMVSSLLEAWEEAARMTEGAALSAGAVGGS
jgi:flagellar protein FliS